MFVVLCGGVGSRMPADALPKPLTLINAKPMLAHVLAHMPPSTTQLLFVYGAHLRRYNFEEVVTNLFRRVRCTFVCLDFATRGAVETALAGVLRADLPQGEPLVFLDNDNVYPAGAFHVPPTADAWVGCAPEATGSSAMSFVTLDCDHCVTSIAEKQRISDTYVTGVYGFRSRALFEEAARAVLRSPNKRVGGEAYLSLVVAHLVDGGARVCGLRVPILPLGTSALAGEAALATFGDSPLRLCFDLDNTLVTYPVVPGDYSTVKPVPRMVTFLRKAKAAGHTVIIHTARRMGSHGHNPGAACADIARVTLDTLDAFGIPYDELLFGKPLADVYFDDRACNPYLQPFRAAGFFAEDEEGGEGGGGGTANRHNVTRREGGDMVKRGPAAQLGDEASFYVAVRPLPIARLFATLVSFEEGQNSGAPACLRTRFERGVTFSNLLLSGLLEPWHLDLLVGALDELHASAPGLSSPPPPTPAEVNAQYDDKLVQRFAVSEHYPFPDAAPVCKEVLRRVRACLERRRLGLAPWQAVPHVHGDCWFANLLLTPTNELKMIDMRGSVAGRRTCGGDPLYDYAKVAQSLLGFDEALRGGNQGSPLTPSFQPQQGQDLLQHFLRSVNARGYASEDVQTLAIALIAGTFWALPTSCRGPVWALLRRLCLCLPG